MRWPCNGRRTAVIAVSAFAECTLQALGKAWFAMCYFFYTLGKHEALPSVFQGTRQTVEKKITTGHQTSSAVLILHALLHVQIWYICQSVCYIQLTRTFGACCAPYHMYVTIKNIQKIDTNAYDNNQNDNITYRFLKTMSIIHITNHIAN